MLASVAYSAERLLLAADWRDAIDDVLLHLGIAAGVSRAYLIEVGAGGDGYRATQLAEWCAPGVSSQFANPMLLGASLSETGFSRWIELMLARMTVYGIVAELPEEERVELTKQDIRSIAAFPVFVDGDWWAFVGFDDCVDEREWTVFELDALRAAAGMLGAAEQERRADTRRHEAEVRYQRLVEQNPAVTYTESHDPEGGRFTFISPQLQDLLGFPPEAPLEDRSWWWAHVHPEERVEAQVANRIAFSQGTDFDQTYRMEKSDGAWAWVRDKVRPVRDEEGRILYWQGFLVGVTERVETEERLLEAEARYRAMVERIPAVTYTDHVGTDGVTMMGFVSPQMEEILGHPPQAFLERAELWFELMHPDDLARLRAIDAFNNSDLEPFEQEYRMRHADGHWVWVHDISTAVLDAQGNLDYFLGFLTDVSSRRDAEERLREAELTFRTLVEQNPAVFYIQSIDPADPTRSRTEYIGPGVEELTGIPIEQMTANPEIWRTMIHPDDQERVFAADGASNTDGSDAFSLEYRMLHKDGSVVWVLDEATLVRPEGRRP
jgi:PAS domain S-box-containing protein